jgi:cyclophilin family peptidyl-prolyl cis-trans isomerase
VTRKGFPAAVASFAVPAADKRQRKKENSRMAREARQAAEKRRKTIRTARNVGIGVVIIVVGIVLINVLTGDDKKKEVAVDSSTTVPTASTVNPAKTYTATVKTNFGDIVLTLDAKKSPIGASRFIKLARDGVYNGSRWHRIVKDFVIQGGAPGGDPTKSVGDAVVGEVPTDHYPVGSLAAAKTGQDPAGTFDSQFFIVTGKAQGEGLANDYARFGSVKSGMDVVKKIEALEADASTQEPKAKATIDKVTISES